MQVISGLIGWGHNSGVKKCFALLAVLTLPVVAAGCGSGGDRGAEGASTVAFVRLDVGGEGERLRLVVVGADGQRLREVATLPQWTDIHNRPTWSPDGRKVLLGA